MTRELTIQYSSDTSFCTPCHGRLGSNWVTVYKNAISGRALYVFELEKTGFMGHPPAIEVELEAGRLN